MIIIVRILASLFCYLWIGCLNIWAISPAILIESLEKIPLSTHLEIFEDISGKLTFEEIQKPMYLQRFVSNLQEVPSFGITKSVYWVRFQLVNHRPDHRFFLEMGFPAMERADLYLKSSKGDWIRKQSGQLRPFHERDFAHPHFVFELDLPSDSIKTYYMRFQTTRALLIPLVLWEPKAFSEYTTQIMFAQGLYFGALLIMLFYNLFIFFSVRDLSYLYYVGYLALFILLVMSVRGISIQYLWTNSPWWAGRSLLILLNSSVIGMLLFSRSFLHTSHDLPKFDKALRIWILFGVLCFVLSFLRLFFVTTLSILFVVSSQIIILWVGSYRWKNGYHAARFFVSAWITLLIGIFIILVQRLGLIPQTFITEYAVQFGSLAEVLLLSFALADRINILKNEKEQAQAKMVALQAKMNEQLEEKIFQRTQDLETAVDKSNKTNEELVLVNKGLKEAQTQLIQSAKLASLGEMSTGVAHEINQPLMIIGLNTESALEEPEVKNNEDLKNNLTTVYSQMQRAAKIVAHLKTFGRDTSKVEFKKVEINQIVENSFILIKEQLKLNDIETIKNLSKTLLYSMGVMTQIEQVIMNLLSNARDAMATTSEKKLQVNTFHLGESVVIEIKDTGHGIPKDNLGKIFDPFFTTKEVGKGTGLGLSISYGLIQKHEGHIEIESNMKSETHPGGTVFRIVLPRIKEG